MSEQDLIEKYKNSRKEFLESLNLEKYSEEEVAVIKKLIQEKSQKDDFILDGGPKDSILKFIRWNIVVLALSYVASMFSSITRIYGFDWLYGFTYYLISISCGFAISVILFIFFTKKFKDNFIKTWKNMSFVAVVFFIIGGWNLCRISYSC